MKESPQKRAVRNYRKRLRERGLMRFEVKGRPVDRELLRALAIKLAANDAAAAELRANIETVLPDRARRTGGILAALRQSPLVGANLTFEREKSEGRTVDL